jgi:PEGA domain
MVRLCLRILLVLCILSAASPAQDDEPGAAQPAPAADDGSDPPATAATSAPPPVKHSPQGYPILEDGTPVRLRLTRTLSSADCRAGDRIDFEVVEPVILDGVTVVPQGAIAWGTVTEAEHKKRMGRGGKLAVMVNSVKLANSEKARLRAVREAQGGGHKAVMGGAMVGTAIVFWPVAPVFLLMHGKDVKIPKGTEITAYVNGDTVFPVAGTPPPAPAETAAPAPQVTAAPEPSSADTAPPGDDAAAAQLTLTSTPDGAEVEVDGEFVGSTPSTIPIATGEHTVRVSKRGFRPYEKRLRIVGGAITLHADLDEAGNRDEP